MGMGSALDRGRSMYLICGARSLPAAFPSLRAPAWRARLMKQAQAAPRIRIIGELNGLSLDALDISVWTPSNQTRVVTAVVAQICGLLGISPFYGAQSRVRLL